MIYTYLSHTLYQLQNRLRFLTVITKRIICVVMYRLLQNGTNQPGSVSEQLRSQLYGNLRKKEPQETFNIRMWSGTAVSLFFLSKTIPSQVAYESARFSCSQNAYITIYFLQNNGY